MRINKEKIYTYFTRKESRNFYLLVTIFISLFYMILIFRNTLPISEGWYSVYAKSINKGLLPYRDFELLFMPIYTYIIALITKVFGYNLIVLRIFGVILYVSTAIIFFLILNKMFSPFISMMATLVSVFFLQTECVYLSYDYIRVFDLFIYLASLMLINLVWEYKEYNKKIIYKYTILCGVLSSLGFLTRQNSGAIFIVFVILTFICLAVIYKNKKIIFNLLIYIASCIIPIVIQIGVLVFTGSFNMFLKSTITNAISAKGGMSAILFNWIIRLIPNIIQLKFQIITIILIMVIGLLLQKNEKHNKENRKINLILCVIFGTITMMGIISTMKYLRLSQFLKELLMVNNIPVIIFVILILMFIVSLIILIKETKAKKDITWIVSFIVLQGVVLSLGYGVGTSAGLSIGETCLGLGIIVALIFKLIGNAYKNKIQIFTILICGLMIGSFVSVKNLEPYGWWGLFETNIKTMSYTVDVPYLKGIKVSQSAKEMYEGTYAIYNKYLKEEEKLFTFPHNPIFYLIADKTPFTYSYVQWFDVSSDLAMEEDMQTIKEEMPKALSIMFVDDFVVSSHEKLFRNNEHSKQREMQEFLKEFIEENGYILVGEYSLNGDNKLSNYIREP